MYQQEIGASDTQDRVAQIFQDLRRGRRPVLTPAELDFGVKVAWRNHTHCIGKPYWKSLIVRDCRHLQTNYDVFEELITHLDLAFNLGRIRPVASIFPEREAPRSIRIRNEQLIQYAGFLQSDGMIIGDPAGVELTRVAQALGWSPPTGGPFDILPIIIDTLGGGPSLFELPKKSIHEIVLVHPMYSWFEDLDLKWYAFPSLSRVSLSMADSVYEAAPFSGWYVSSEIAALDLAARYEMIPRIAHHLHYSLKADTADDLEHQALVELNTSIVWSFTQAGIRIAQPDDISRLFLRYAARQRKIGYSANVDGNRIVPPMVSPGLRREFKQFRSVLTQPHFFRN